MSTVHVVPTSDQIEHVTSGGDCPCGPTVEAVFRDDGSNGWLVTHHSLDSREQRELIRRMRDDAAANGDYQSAAELDALLTTPPGAST